MSEDLHKTTQPAGNAYVRYVGITFCNFFAFLCHFMDCVFTVRLWSLDMPLVSIDQVKSCNDNNNLYISTCEQLV